MIEAIDAAKAAGDTMGGGIEVIATGVPIGLGSYVQWDRKLDGRLAHALMSIPAIKAVGIGIGPEAAARPGSRVHDEIVLDTSGGVMPFARPTNNAGGLEGGVTNGEDVRVSAWMKPIATLMKPLRSVDLTTLTESGAAIERSDVCAVPAAAVVSEAMVALTLADALVEKFGGDSLPELRRSIDAWAAEVGERLRTKESQTRRGVGQMLRPILRYGERPLHAPAEPVSRFDQHLHALIDDMIQTMYSAPGIGLAAPQVGVAQRVFVADLSVGRDPSQLIVMVNPEFVEREGTQLEEEGCLSLPGFNATVLRPARAVVRGLDREGPSSGSKARGCWPAPSSTRSITSTAACSSIACAASSAT